MKPRARIVVAAWVAGWSLITAAITAIVGTAWPALPPWAVPAASAGALLLQLAIEARPRRPKGDDDQDA